MDIQLKIQNVLTEIIKKLTGEEIQAIVTIPADLKKGDFTTNLPLRVSKKLGNPMDSGEKIVEELRKREEYKLFTKIELIKPGFINFFLSEAEIVRSINQVLSFNISSGSEKEMIMEFGDLNPFKEPHIGHIRNLTLGESISRLAEFLGNKVVRANYEGDVGMHVAKCIWGIQDSGEFEAFEKKNLEERAKFLGKCYAAGAKAFEENEESRKEIILINIKVYQKDSQVIKIWEKGRSWSLEYFEELYKKIGVKYDKYYFESEIAENGKDIVLKNPNVFEKDEGAYVFRGDKDGLHTRVFINSSGNPTYEAKDLGLAFAKNKDYPEIKKSIIMTANEQTEYFKVLLNALSKIDKNLSDKTEHLSYGFIDLKEGKMSSRSGNIVSGFWLIDETRNRLKKDFNEVSDDVIDALSVGAVKWSMLKFSRESNIKFSIDESIDLAGNSGPYMQYTYARIASLIDKSKNEDIEAISVKTFSPELIALIRLVCQFNFNIKSSLENFSPNILCNYLFALAQNFNAFYEKEKVIGSSNEKEKIIVINVIGKVLEKGLFLLGIEAPKKI